MDRMLVVVFDSEAKVYAGRRALRDLDHRGHVTVYAAAMIAKRADGSTILLKDDDPGVLGSLVGTSLGTVIGMLGGPAGMALGATAGLTLGIGADMDHAVISEDFIDDVLEHLAPGKAALVAEVEEDWVTATDTLMESLGGSVFRRAVSEVRHTFNQEAIAAMKADLAQLTAEHAQAGADRKSKLVQKINQLEAKIQAQMQKSKARREAAQREAQAKADTLRAKAAAAKSTVSH